MKTGEIVRHVAFTDDGNCVIQDEKAGHSPRLWDKPFCPETLFLAIFLSGCQSPFMKADPPPERPVTDEIVVDRQIAESAKRIEEQLTRLARMNYARDPVKPKSYKTPPADPLARPVTFHWDGPLEPGVSALAKLSGYKVEVHGRRPPSPVVVSVDKRSVPSYEILQDLGWQVGESIAILVDRSRRVVRIAYGLKRVGGHAAD